MTQLEQILNYLDRDGVTEVIVAVGQPIQFRRNGALVPLTNATLTRIQVSALVANTPLATIFGKRGEGEIQIGKRTLKVTATGTAEAPALSIVRAAVAAATTPTPSRGPALPQGITERTRRPSKLMKSERGPSPTKPPRTRGGSRPAPSAPATAPIAAPAPTAPAAPPAKQLNRLTKSDIKFTSKPRTPEPQHRPLDLDPTTSGGPELDSPALGLGARANPGALQLDLDDDGIELGAPGATPARAGAAPDVAFASPRSPHAGSTPAIDAAFAGPSLDALGPRVPSAATARPQVVPMAPMVPFAPTAAPAPAITSTAPIAPVAPAPMAMPVGGATATVPDALRALLDEATRRRASDLHVIVNRPVCVRVMSELAPLRTDAPEALDAAAVEALLLPLLDDRGRAQLERAGYADLAIELPGGGRSRTNISRCQGGLRGTFRIARPTPPTLDELGLPKELAKVIAHHQGLVVIAGPSGAGKTTTLAALVDLINSASAFHIITVEDPIEIVYPRKAAVVSQREVGAHTRSFAAALKGSLREDPDVIVIGELRDRETVEIALTAAETGHLVLATMSTPSAAKTIDRLVDMFPPDDQQQVRASIAGALRAIVSQRLLPTTSGNAVVAAVELLTGVLPLAAMIRDDKLFQLPSLMQRGRAFGMIRLDDSLAELVRTNKITSEVALGACDNRKELATRLQQGTSALPTFPAGRKS